VLNVYVNFLIPEGFGCGYAVVVAYDCSDFKLVKSSGLGGGLILREDVREKIKVPPRYFLILGRTCGSYLFDCGVTSRFRDWLFHSGLIQSPAGSFQMVGLQ